ncbi:hypothetical protein AUC43_00070 [Hymenobacter sedentarius]|uniref:Uncharacterized protein n=1 Tax=Hymenobacter sedentarius TaxID=1411621 RepID=A0A0U4AU71_9BACT|nr:hypothetical protein AUC43_00070 [Hymenobacter sedentarius]
MSPQAAAQKATPARALAVGGDTVWVIVNSVKPDKRTQYERFVNEIFWPLSSKLGAADQRTFRQTRVLNAYRPDADGTYPYLFIMDPVQRGQSYDMLAILGKVYDKAKAAEYYKLFTESLARPQKQYTVVQSRF